MNVNVFIASVSEDKVMFDTLVEHLSTLERSDDVVIFYEQKIIPGQDRKKEIEDALEKADIVLLLFSPSFMNSDFHYEKIALRSIENTISPKYIVPVILRECSLESTPFSTLQRLPKENIPIADNSWSSKDSPYSQVEIGIREIIKELRNEKNKINTTVIKFTSKIGNYTPKFNDIEVQNALRKYSISGNHINIDYEDFDRNRDGEYWTKYSSDLNQKIIEAIKSREKFPNHISIFGFAVIPLLISLGKSIGETIPTSVFPINRNTHPNARLLWLKGDEYNPPYYTDQIESSGVRENVAIVIALSDFLEKDKYENITGDRFNIYKLTVEEPSVYYLQSEIQLSSFACEFSKLLNRIQAKHGKNTPVHIFAAMPAAVSIKMGLILLSTKNQPLYLYDYSTQKGFRKVLQLK